MASNAMTTMRIHGIRTALPFAAIAFALSAGACASATKRFEQGQELEQQGRPADAAQRYVDALKKDRAMAGARERLAETGAAAIADYARQADALAATGVNTDAADVLREADALIRDAADVGVALRSPSGYSERHALIFDRAVDQALVQAASASNRGDFSESVRIVERAQERWQPSVDQQYALSRVLHDTHIAWGRHEVSASRFRSAYAQGDAAAQIPGFDRREADMLKREAVRRGTVLVAAFPVAAHAGVDNRLLPELNDLLALDHWRQPPQWIDMVNAIEEQRVVRLRGLTGRELDAADAATLGRQVGARYAVALTLDSIRYSESKVERRRRPAKTRAGVDTAFTVEEGQLETWARVSWRAIDVAGGRSVVERGDATDRATTQFRRPTYAGNWRDLDLSGADRALFEQRDARDNQDALRRIARALADKLGSDVFDALLRRIE